MYIIILPVYLGSMKWNVPPSVSKEFVFAFLPSLPPSRDEMSCLELNCCNFVSVWDDVRTACLQQRLKLVDEPCHYMPCLPAHPRSHDWSCSDLVVPSGPFNLLRIWFLSTFHDEYGAPCLFAGGAT